MSNENENKQNNDEEISPLEQKATSMGWNVNFDGPKEEFKTAGEFVRNAQLYSDLSKANSRARNAEFKIKEIRGQLKQLSELQLELLKQNNQKEVAQLRQAKRNALSQNELVTADELDEQIKKVEKETEQTTDKYKLTEESATTQEYTKEDFIKYYNDIWIDQNSWYTTNSELETQANSLITTYMKENPNAAPEELFTEVSTQMQFPTKNKVKSKKNTQQVESGSSNTRPSRNKNSKASLNSLDDEVKDMAKNMIALKISLGKSEEDATTEVLTKLSGEK